MAHVRFETWSMVPDELAEHRRRLMVAALAAALSSMALGLTSWTADKLGISRVAPPKHTYAVTLQVLEPPPPPAPPPAAPAAAERDADDRPAAPDEPVTREPDEPPTEVLKIDLDARPQARASVPGALGGGTKGGGIPGIPGGGGGCPLPPCIGTQQVIGDSFVRPQPRLPAAEPVQAPIKAVMATSIFTPNPEQARLSRTVTGRTHRRPGKSTVAFCIDGSGKTYEVRTRRGFPGDPEVDEICRSTVSKWRFSPQRVGGKARSTCTSVTFDIHFE
jgi:periplasmic protein TonB